MKTEEELEQIAQEKEMSLETLITERPLIAHDDESLVDMVLSIEVGLDMPDALWSQMELSHKQIILAVFQATASRELQLRQ